jgi:histidinol-phosphate aminotransferase
MIAASNSTGVLYICNPNNPTGTCTPRADIEFAVSHAPKNTILLIDEAYIHFCDQPRSLDYVKEGRNVIVLRTFSKIYGMAGLRMGFAIGRPDLLKRLDYFGRNPLPAAAMFAARASLSDSALVPTRKVQIASTRAETTAWLRQLGYAVTPSESNCFMVDARRPAKDVIAAMAAKDVYIGRPWPSCPTQVRITVGLPEEMAAFRKAFAEVMSAA